MARYEAAVDIDAAPETIFPYLVEPDRLKRWVGGFVEAHPLTTGPTGLGSKSVDVVREGTREMRFQTEITAYDPPSHLTVTIAAPGMDAVSDYRIERSPRGGHVTHVQRVRYGGPLRVFGPFVGRMVRRKLREDLLRLKAAVERS